MSRCEFCRPVALFLPCALLLTLAACGGGPAPAERVTYPAPRYPHYLVASGGDLMEAARTAVRQPYGRSPLGKMQSGQTVHVFLQYGQDMDVWEAVRRAWAERGVEAKAIGSWELMGLTEQAYNEHVKKNLLFGNEAWQEIGVFRPVYLPFFPDNLRSQFKEAFTSSVVRKDFEKYLDGRPDINFMFAGTGGGTFWARAAGKHGDKFLGNWIFGSRLELLGKAAQFPGDVWNMVDDKIIKPIPHVAEGAFTDPEGTDLRWTITPEQAKEWSASSGSSNHLNIYPELFKATVLAGTIRASANHTGFYPVMTVTIDKLGRIETIEGGGKTGDMFRALVDNPKMKNAKFPTAPESGYWFLSQDGFATNPKFVRDMQGLIDGAQNIANLSERNRAGVQHFSFSHPANPSDPSDIAYAKEQGLPFDHTAHMHVYFGTLRWKLADTGEWVTISENGNVKAFEDPEVRALAAKYGNPDLIFRYEWIPSIPGVNVPGDHDRDYGADPWKWIMAEWDRIQNGSYEYFVEDYKMQITAAPAAVPDTQQ